LEQSANFGAGKILGSSIPGSGTLVGDAAGPILKRRPAGAVGVCANMAGRAERVAAPAAACPPRRDAATNAVLEAVRSMVFVGYEDFDT